MAPHVQQTPCIPQATFGGSGPSYSGLGPHVGHGLESILIPPSREMDTICRMRPLSCWWSLGQEYVLERPGRVLQYFCVQIWWWTDSPAGGMGEKECQGARVIKHLLSASFAEHFIATDTALGSRGGCSYCVDGETEALRRGLTLSRSLVRSLGRMAQLGM